ncbi:contractile injection system protein, VgrG/Pvc8 family [Sorangium sp. So ce513]|uniref:contractile injection system protein, VgrG/Pvc8 family n=1 Tax=Sorangium sp. So ce513 TaxID=3133315 RepID=UPI003F5F2BE7
MAQRSVRLEWAALAGVPFVLCRTRPSAELHGLYRVEVELVLDDPASLRGRALSKSSATLVYSANGEDTVVHGMAVGLRQEQRADLDGVSLHLALVPRVWEMTHGTARGTFLGQTVPEIVARKLTAAGFKRGEDFRFCLQREHRPHERLVQHDRSDFDFIEELCKLAGLSLSFDHGCGREVLIISDTGIERSRDA